jgi:hypothetical protein
MLSISIILFMIRNECRQTLTGYMIFSSLLLVDIGFCFLFKGILFFACLFLTQREAVCLIWILYGYSSLLVFGFLMYLPCGLSSFCTE